MYGAFVAITFFTRLASVKGAWGAWGEVAERFGGTGPGGVKFWQPKLSGTHRGQTVRGWVRAEPVRRRKNAVGLGALLPGGKSTAITKRDADKMGKGATMRWISYLLQRRRRRRRRIGRSRRRRRYELIYYTDFEVDLTPRWSDVSIIPDEDDVTPADRDEFFESQFQVRASDRDELLSGFSTTGADNQLLELSAMWGHIQVDGGTLLGRRMEIVDDADQIVSKFDELIDAAEAMQQAREGRKRAAQPEAAAESW